MATNGKEETEKAGSSIINLFTPYKMGKFNLSHRVVMPPLTRCRALNLCPNSAMTEYYSQRATQGGLLISEATFISPTAIGYPHVPGILTSGQVQEWTKVVDAVHAKGGIFFCQLWHVGRASHTGYQPNNGAPVSSTNKPISSKWQILLQDGSYAEYSHPRALSTSEILEIIEQYRRCSLNAIRAGFDGVEIHGGSGYLVEQFLKDGINDRDDEYGGSIQSRCKFLLQIISALVDTIGAERVAVKISPTLCDNLDAFDSDPVSLGLAVIRGINEIQKEKGVQLAYIHIQTGDRDHHDEKAEELLRIIRITYEGTLLVCGDYTRELGMKAVSDKDADLIAYGRLFISNPDLVQRFKVNARLNVPNPATFAAHDLIEGYLDYDSSELIFKLLFPAIC